VSALTTFSEATPEGIVEPVNAKEFFKFIFGTLDGYLCLVTIDRSKEKEIVRQRFFEYPVEIDKAIDFVERKSIKVDIYFAPFLMTQARRMKEDIAETPVVWSDGDTCPIESLLIEPSAVVRTSTGRHHFYWKLDPVESPDIGEYLSKKIAYYHAEEGMDKSGWDLTQLLRVPGTYNHKKVPPQPVSKAIVIRDATYKEEDFSDYPEVEYTNKTVSLDDIDIPDVEPEELLDKYSKHLSPRAYDLYVEIPLGDWSRALWELECTLAEAGMTAEEIFVVARMAACNKFNREKRGDLPVWKDVQRAVMHVQDRKEKPPEIGPERAVVNIKAPKLLTDEQRELAKSDVTFIEEYTEWAKTLGDAATQYHPAGAFVILSTLLSGVVKLPTSFGTVVPNLWFMILADTTLTRKSTAMDNATDLLLEIDEDLLLATDGSIEGLLTAMSTRSGKPSLFLRDEVTGLLEAMAKKEYMAGMMEMLTKLYDGKHMKRILRREVIDVENPRLIIFSGGIRNKMVELLDYKHVGSGFLPRFIFITAESDITKLRPVGPPTNKTIEGRTGLLNKMHRIYDFYTMLPTQRATNGGKEVHLPKRWSAELTDEAWSMYNSYEVKMLNFAMESHDPTLLTPMMDRLAKSGLKAAVLISASRLRKDKIVVDKTDLLHAFYYIEQWMEHTVYIIRNIGTSGDEQKVQRVYQKIVNEPGIMRSKLMQNFFLHKKDTDAILATLEERAVIRRERHARNSERLYPVE
jgi:hypothetical protein